MKTKIIKVGQKCRKCQTPVIKRIPKRRKFNKNQKYYFKSYLFCPNCKEMYMVESEKVYIRDHENAKPKIVSKSLKRREKQANKLMLNQRKQNNANEREFRIMLFENKIDYIWQQPFFDKTRYVCVDFYFPKTNIVIEIDGKYHDEQIIKDTERTRYLKKVHKIKEVIRITNKQVALQKDEIIDLIFDKLA